MQSLINDESKQIKKGRRKGIVIRDFLKL